jgi:crotonobetaine/carnitine-CoA ligase
VGTSLSTHQSMTHLHSSQALLARVSDPSSCVLPEMLDRQATRLGEKKLFVFADGSSWTYAEARRRARGTAAALEALGVERGDRVLVLLRDGPDMIRISLAVYYLGAVLAPLNPELTGDILTGLVTYSDADLLVTTSDLVEQLSAEQGQRLQRVVVLDDSAPRARAGLEMLPGEVLKPSDRDPKPLDPPLQPWDIHTLFFTSGTTGVSKGVESTHAHCATMAIDGLPDLKEEDRFCTPCGFFHVGGAYAPWAVINRGASMLVVGKFSASRFWQQIRSNAVSVALLVGVMADFLLARPPQPDDADNPLRLVVMQPLTRDAGTFATRFGLSIYTQYDQTETPPAITSEIVDPANMPAQGYCGRLRAGFDARVVDENDCEVPDGQSGELVLRCDAPWIIATGYFRKPEATAQAWRNGWFHTGDIFRRDADGRFFFVDRSKDVIRRRGENISSFDIEAALATHPDVEAAAAFGVQGEFSENEVMAVVQLREGVPLTPEALDAHMAATVPRFMVPRFLRFLSELPRSATDKVKKDELRRQGRTADTWDRDNADSAEQRVYAAHKAR